MVFILAAFLYLIPGLALLALWYPKYSELDWLEKFVLSAGIGLSIYPVFLLWTNLFGLQLGRLYAWLPPIIGTAYLLFYYRKYFRRGTPWRAPTSSLVSIPHLVLLALLGLIVFTRLWAVQDLDLPLWGDSIQHTMITQLLVDNQGLFNSWEPYARLQTLTYHFGFHSLAALLTWVSGIPVAKGVLVSGQLLNVLAALAVYPLARRVALNQWTGVIAILLAGLMFSMPMFYLNWGRYTQLAGIVIMGTLVYLLWDAFESKKLEWRLMFLSWIAFSGLALTHYRVLVFVLIFPFAWLLLNFRRRNLLPFITRLFIIGFGSIILCLPWLIHTVAGKLDFITLNQLKAPASQAADYARQTTSFGNLLTYLPGWAWLSLPFALGWGLWKRNHGIALISLWWSFILLAANPHWLNLPGAGVITTFAVMITIFFPTSIILGSAAGWIIGKVFPRNNQPQTQIQPSETYSFNWFVLALPVLILGVALLSTKARMDAQNPDAYSLAMPADIQAFQWIKENTPSDAGFLVNSFFAYGGSAIVGSDAGWWLPLLANRQTSLPPLVYGTEIGPFANYPNWINDLPQMIQEKGINHPVVMAELQERGLNYIYIGQHQGRLNSPAPLLDLESLLSNPTFKPVYHQDQVWIFKIVQSPPGILHQSRGFFLP